MAGMSTKALAAQARADQPPIAGVDPVAFRSASAEAIRALGRRVASDIVEIGNRLIAVRKTCEHGEWLPWLDREFGWSDQTARNFMSVAEGFKSQTVLNLPIDAGALYRLSGPKVSPAIREEAIALAEAGEHITKAKAEEMVAHHARRR
jgi:hypothetical protein